jgi:F-type H+-transporting ATPase subunit delta
MSDNYTYSRPYGEAAFKLALEENVIDQWSSNLKTLAQVIVDKDIKAVIADPKIPQVECSKLLCSFLGTSVDKNTSNFIDLLLDNKRIIYLKEISDIFEDMKSDHNNVCIINIETSRELEPDQINTLKELFKKKYNSDIEIAQTINSDLLAGIRVKVNDEVIDLSLQNRFNQIKQQLII